ncbi:hypothetical protein [Thalassoroseus pseudoceratinae]|uniref:hypothetical protein n=1 Tax=Thalassoroseus pseudoceratinae TaxID=2713176 RepID=UPI0014218FB7|nr:hypothetical protein [Thalassoroseus pseudoceratinae]
MSPRLACFVLVGLLTVSGCGGGSSVRQWFGGPREFPEATAENPAVEVVSVWQPAEGTGINGLPSRGFAGQVMFFTRTMAEPVKVHGNIRIYLFDDTGTIEERKKPIHQFDFTPEAWNTHITDGTLGASYNVFVPYTKDNPYQTRCTLRVRIQQEGKPPVFSESVAVTLPGPMPKDVPKRDAVPHSFTMKKSTVPINPSREDYEAAVQQASHQAKPSAATSAKTMPFTEEEMAAIQEKLHALQKERSEQRQLPQTPTKTTATQMFEDETPSKPQLQPLRSKRFRLTAAPGTDDAGDSSPEPIRHRFDGDFRPISDDSGYTEASQLFE